MRSPVWRLLAALAVVALVGAACSDDPPEQASPSTTVVDDEPETTTTTTTTAPAEVAGDVEDGTSGPAFDFAAVDETVAAFVTDQGLNGAGLIIVHREHGVIHHEHWGVYDENRVSLIASSSKMVTAGVLLHLQDDGLLDLDTPIAEYVDWGAGNPEITTAQLLSNSSGLQGLLSLNPYGCVWVSDTTLQECAAEVMTTDADDADVVPPDTEFRYGGAQWQVAGGVAEAVSGQTWAELIDEIYVEPCGLEFFGYDNHYDQLAPSGFAHPAGFDSNPAQLSGSANPNLEGGAYSNTGDYGALLLMHLRDGMCGDVQVLSPGALALAHGDRIAEAYGGDAWDAATGYGLGWWVDRDNGHRSDGGAFGSTPWLDLEDGYGAFLVIEASSRLGQQLSEQLFDVVEAAVVG